MTSIEAGLHPVQSGRFFGKYRGTVEDNQDPQGRGRIIAKVPAVLGETPTGWAMPCLPYAGNKIGTFLVPPVGAGVWVEFEAGDHNYPIWSGCWWDEGESPAKEDGGQATPEIKLIRSEAGLIISLNDADNSVFIGDSNGSNSLKISVSDGKFVIKVANKVVIEAPQIELVENASQAVVMGDELKKFLEDAVNKFNAHMHPGQMAGPVAVTPVPPSPPMMPPLPTILSTKVKTG